MGRLDNIYPKGYLMLTKTKNIPNGWKIRDDLQENAVMPKYDNPHNGIQIFCGIPEEGLFIMEKYI